MKLAKLAKLWHFWRRHVKICGIVRFQNGNEQKRTHKKVPIVHYNVAGILLLQWNVLFSAVLPGFFKWSLTTVQTGDWRLKSCISVSWPFWEGFCFFLNRKHKDISQICGGQVRVGPGNIKCFGKKTLEKYNICQLIWTRLCFPRETQSFSHSISCSSVIGKQS